MITIPVDEAYAFDFLSILDIKRKITSNYEGYWKECKIHIENKIGNEKMNKILNSQEYLNMVKANQMTFDAVEKARYGEITAKEVDDANMIRHKRKLELQAKFFDNKLTEYKT